MSSQPELICEAHKDCKEPVVARVGLPSFRAKWVCEKGFAEFREMRSSLLSEVEKEQK